ncbi:hypothetical protein [Pontiella agarivorans]|uniref:Uncharacterized protein n=1 Tax=Pontiella agarivorans TaxID=3038953 RepID=A0ABU5MWP7_9BACT|nr:hypothetical protein [Pontiella agarivorans]MDZ8118558.1 hypothetical protein [Pontiella agarivorans]
MSLKYTRFLIPGLGVLCIAGAVAVVISARAPMETGFSMDGETPYDVRVPENFDPGNDLPTMEEVVEKHLFVKERKATGQNTFPDLLVKGVYVGEESSAVFSLKYRPEANLRVWKGDVDSVISRITDSRDSRKPIVDFLSEWDIKEITFEGVTVEHIITGEVETYRVDYTPAKHVKDNAEAGYGQGMLAVIEQGGSKTAKTSNRSAQNSRQASNSQRAQAFQQMRSMVESMSPDQRARLAERISSGFQPGGQQSNRNSSNSGGSRNSGSSSRNSGSSSQNSGSSSRSSSGGGGRSR